MRCPGNISLKYNKKWKLLVIFAVPNDNQNATEAPRHALLCPALPPLLLAGAPSLITIVAATTTALLLFIIHFIRIILINLLCFALPFRV